MSRAGPRLAAILLAVALAGCVLVPTPWVGGWQLRTVGGIRPFAASTIVFTATDVVIETGCNTGAGGYEVSGGRLTLKGVAFTATACTDVLVRQDSAFIALGKGTPTLSVSGDTLTIDPGGGGAVLVFDRTSGA
jgi:heat shock protein HslJ